MSDAKQLDQDTTTKLVTSLNYLGAGPEAIAELQNRLDHLTGADSRIIVGEISTNDEGEPICGLSFNCGSYDPPVDGEPDPRALKDLREALSTINLDGCIVWGTIELLTGEPTTS